MTSARSASEGYERRRSLTTDRGGARLRAVATGDREAAPREGVSRRSGATATDEAGEA